jgi:hypothetical protein
MLLPVLLTMLLPLPLPLWFSVADLGMPFLSAS